MSQYKPNVIEETAIRPDTTNQRTRLTASDVVASSGYVGKPPCGEDGSTVVDICIEPEPAISAPNSGRIHFICIPTQ
jgi:hypothetical protein